MFKGRKFVAALAVLLMLSACASYKQNNYVARPGYADAQPSVAVMRFTNLTNYPKAGQVVADIFTSVLYQTDAFRVMSKEEQMKKVQTLAALEVDTERKARQIGQRLGVDAVVFGSVSEYRYKQGLSESPIVGLNLRMVDVKSGHIVWTASHTKAGGSALNANTQQISEKMIARFLRKH